MENSIIAKQIITKKMRLVACIIAFSQVEVVVAFFYQDG
jgi:hypothetical protein